MGNCRAAKAARRGKMAHEPSGVEEIQLPTFLLSRKPFAPGYLLGSRVNVVGFFKCAVHLFVCTIGFKSSFYLNSKRFIAQTMSQL